MLQHSTIPLEEAARVSGPMAFTIMLKPAGSLCNMGCTYCYYLDKVQLYGGREPRMSLPVLEQVTRAYIEANDVSQVQFVWHGGEPLVMGLPFFTKAMEYQKRYAGGKKILNSIQTNGLLVNQEWARFFRKNDFLVGLSLDGPRDIHDRYRLDRGGQPSFDRVMDALKCLTDHQVSLNTLSAVSRASEGHGREVYAFLKEAGVHYMQFLPVVEFVRAQGKKARPEIVEPKAPGATPSSWSVSAEAFGDFMCDVFDQWISRDVGQYYVQLFDSTLAAWCGRRDGVCVFGKSCFGNAVIEHNGDLFACDHFVYPSYKIGNVLETPIRELMETPQVKQFAYRKCAGLPLRCRRCPYLPACNGECPQHRDAVTGVNRLCEGYRHFFRHVTPYMNQMRALLENHETHSTVH